MAATLPLSISTAAAALYERSHLNLALPSEIRPESQDTILVIDAVSGVGSAAVQLAVASRFRVIKIALNRDVDLVSKLRADFIIDLETEDVCERVMTELGKNRMIGIFDTSSTSESTRIMQNIIGRLGPAPKICRTRPLPREHGDFQYTVGGSHPSHF